MYYDVKLSEYIPGPNDINLDPHLRGPLSGAFDKMELTAASPAIDAGKDAVCPIYDHGGLSRPKDSNGDGETICDIGAHEWDPDSAWLYLPMLADTSAKH